MKLESKILAVIRRQGTALVLTDPKTGDVLHKIRDPLAGWVSEQGIPLLIVAPEGVYDD